MRKIVKFSLLFLIVLSTGCEKKETKPLNSANSITYHYIVNEISYTVVMNQNEDGTFDVGSELNEDLISALDCPNSILLTDPFKKNTYYVFKTQKDSEEKNREIIEKMNDFEFKNRKFKNQNELKSGGVVGSIKVHKDRYYQWPIGDYSKLLTSNEYFSSLGGWTDKISSYQVWCNTITGPRPDGKRSVIRFYEHSKRNGKVLTAYGFFTHWQSDGDYQISWEDSNMHGTLMTGGIFNRKYWGDQVSSIEWKLE